MVFKHLISPHNISVLMKSQENCESKEILNFGKLGLGVHERGGSSGGILKYINDGEVQMRAKLSDPQKCPIRLKLCRWVSDKGLMLETLKHSNLFTVANLLFLTCSDDKTKH